MKNNTQNLFRVTRKSIFSIVCTFTLLAASGSGIAYAAESASETVSESSTGSVIGSEAAQNFAFADAGVDPVSATAVYTEYDYEDGQFVYEVEFTADGTEYDYQIQAYTGSVLKKSVEYTSLIASLYTAADSGTALSLEEAKALAQNEAELLEKEAEDTANTENDAAESTAEGASESAADDSTAEDVFTVTFTKEKLDNDDGLSVYDIEFYTDTAEYEYEISAVSGEILSFSMELTQSTLSGAASAAANTTGADNSVGTSGAAGSGSTTNVSGDAAGTTSGTSSGTTCISLDDAKTIALEKAGVSTSDVTFKKAKLDKEDGMMVYEVEFYQGQMEYECTINASTGAIIEFESEWDD
ncbi:MAG: PepSY domain-containing protein [Lachnospiraceae bacterium]|nr:PepSY domain-containing protein [Lachnospiraceae bacterium]